MEVLSIGGRLNGGVVANAKVCHRVRHDDADNIMDRTKDETLHTGTKDETLHTKFRRNQNIEIRT